MAQIQVYLGFTDRCREAMEFYRSCFGGDLSVQTVAQSPVAKDMPAESQELVLHAMLVKGDLTLMASDMATDATPNASVSLLLQCTSADEIERCFQSLAVGGRVTHPLGPSFWGSTFGHLTDRFGIRWMLNLTH